MKKIDLSIFMLVIIRILRIKNDHVVNAGIVDSSLKVENIIKSPRDDRSYRGLKLNNDMNVLLISDPTTSSSAASMTVRTGFFNDIEDLHGLAHLLEHMLIRSTKKYPRVNEFQKFIYDHRGIATAYTGTGVQTFQFQIIPDSFSEALDRFAQFFLEPLIDASVLEREIMDVDLEYQTYSFFDDDTRIIYLQKFLRNFETLSVVPKLKGISVQEKLSEFHSTRYSSNIMYLVVLGPENLSKLEGMVTTLFEKIPNKQVQNVIPSEHPWGPEQLNHKVYVVPFNDKRILRIVFPIPVIFDQYKTAPARYISELFDHQGAGSLFSLLHMEGLCILRLDSSMVRYHEFKEFGFFVINFHLTEEALNRVDEIITSVFQYIRLLKTEGIQAGIFEDGRRSDELAFEYKEQEPLLNYLTHLSIDMANYPIEDILSYNLRSRWEPSLILEFLDYLTPDNMNIFIVSKSFENVANQIEPWYEVKYKIETIGNDLTEKWRTVQPSPILKLPEPNQFIPQSLTLYPAKNVLRKPIIIKESSISRMWFKQDDQFQIPKINIQFEIFSPISCLDPHNSSLTKIFLSLVNVSLNKDIYPAKLAGYEWEIRTRVELNCGIQVQLLGFSDKIEMLLQKLMSSMTSNFKINEKDFYNYKEEQIRSLRNFVESEEPRVQANFYVSHLLRESGWSMKELLVATESLQLDDIKKFVPRLFSRIFIQGFIYGNSDKQNAMKLINIIEGPLLSIYGVLSQQLVLPRQVELSEGSNYVYEVSNKYHKSSCYLTYFQISTTYDSLIRRTILIELFLLIAHSQCHDTLRTREQLGYLVSCTIQGKNGVYAFTISVQSLKHPLYVDTKVEKFLGTLHRMLENMTEREFEAHLMTLATIYTQGGAPNFKVMSDEYWHTISRRLYHSEKIRASTNELYKLTKRDMLNFFKEFFDPSSRTRRKLSIHVVSRITNPSVPGGVDTNNVRIEDITTFKNSLGLLPLSPLFEGISPLGTKWS